MFAAKCKHFVFFYPSDQRINKRSPKITNNCVQFKLSLSISEYPLTDPPPPCTKRMRTEVNCICKGFPLSLPAFLLMFSSQFSCTFDPLDRPEWRAQIYLLYHWKLSQGKAEQLLRSAVSKLQGDTIRRSGSSPRSYAYMDQTVQGKWWHTWNARNTLAENWSDPLLVKSRKITWKIPTRAFRKVFRTVKNCVPGGPSARDWHVSVDVRLGS